LPASRLHSPPPSRGPHLNLCAHERAYGSVGEQVGSGRRWRFGASLLVLRGRVQEPHDAGAWRRNYRNGARTGARCSWRSAEGLVAIWAGLVASTYMRGIDYVQVPTTCWRSGQPIGGKTAVNVRAYEEPGGYLYPPSGWFRAGGAGIALRARPANRLIRSGQTRDPVGPRILPVSRTDLPRFVPARRAAWRPS